MYMKEYIEGDIFMTKENKKVELKRVNMNLPLSLVNRIEEYAYNMGLNITSAYIILLNQALDNKDMFKNLPILLNAINDVKILQNDKNDD